MTNVPNSARLIVGDMESAQAALCRERPDWPAADEVDAAGVQLILAAMRSGLAPPDTLRTAPALRELWTRLGLDDVLPLGPAPE